MSAIAGICCLDGRPVDRADLERMVAILAHRGPDGAGVWSDGRIGLGHRMLWTTPESLHECLPLVHQAGDLVLTADARIDNRAELIATLGLTDRPPTEIADSQLILAAYGTWGERCAEKLLGDFAFAIWDGRKQVLFCARDYFGIKPFYYSSQPGRAFVFASEIKALLCVPWVPCRLNEVRVADYVTSLVEDEAVTFYQQVFRLPRAHSMTVGREELRLRAYWSLDPGREIRYRSDEAYAEAFRDIFTEAVRCRLRSAFPVGASLSGGLDSSAVVCVARRLFAGNGHRPLRTFSAIFDDVPECDERSFINTILAQGGVEPHYVHPDRLGALTEIERVLWHQDQPFYIRNLFLIEALYGAAQQQGVRVMLDGEDGDTVISHGEEYLAELARAGRWTMFAREAKGLGAHFQNYNVSPISLLRKYGFTYLTELARAGQWAAFASAAHEISRRFEIPRWQLCLHQGLKPLAPKLVQRAWWALRGQKRAQGSRNALINASFAERVGIAERARVHRTSASARTLREGHWLDLTGGITSCIQEENDKTAAAFAIESRHPFWDRRLVEFCLALPPEQKLHQGWPRWILRRAMTHILPDEIQWRVGKSRLDPNFTRSLLVFERERLEEVLVKNPKVIEKYVDTSALREAYRRGDANTIWPAVILALWLHRTGLTS